MRKVGLLASALSVALFACSTILGDFSVGDGGAGDGGGNDAPGNDAPGNDAGPDVVGDAGPDVQPVKLANCSLDTTKPIVFNWPNQTTTVDDGDRVFVFQIANRNRLFVQHNNSIYYADFNDNDTTATLTQFSVQGQFINSTHVNGTTPGTVFLVWDPTGQTVSYVKWLDTPNAAPTVGTTILTATQLAGTPQNNFPFKGTITAIDLSLDDYLFAVEYTFDPQGQSFKLGVGHAKGTTIDTYQVIDSTAGPDLNAQSISHDQGSAYFWIQPGSNGNVPQGPANLYIMDIPNWTLSQTLHLAPQSGFYVPFAMSVGGPGTTDIAFLEGDLSNQNSIPMMHTQAVPTNTLANLQPQTVPGTQVTIPSLPVNKGVTHWWSFAMEDDWIGAGRPLGNNGLPGVNIMWFDSKGNARALIQESDGGGGFPSIPVDSIDMTLTGTPSLVLSGIRAAWIEGQGQQQSPKVISMPGQCTTF